MADTSVWISHLRDGNSELASLLNEGHVICHPFIIGELACGQLRNRSEILSLLQALPMATKADDAEVLTFIENHRLVGKGLGYINMHLLVSAVLNHMPLWTLDKNLHGVSVKLRLGFRQY